MKRRIVIIIISVCVVLAAGMLFLPQSAPDMTGTVLSVTVTQDLEGKQSVVVKLDASGEEVYVSVSQGVNVKTVEGKPFAIEYLQEGDTLSVWLKNGQETARVKAVKKAVWQG